MEPIPSRGPGPSPSEPHLRARGPAPAPPAEGGRAAAIRAGDIRAAMRPEALRRCLWRALRVVMPGAIFYLAALAGTVLVPFEWARVLLSLVTGLAASLLFVLGHDAAHDSLTPFRRLNAILARLLFVPSWHPYTGWVHGHNHVHHGWTNLSPVDYVWVPLSREEYSRLPAWRRAIVRLHRRWPGFGLYYSSQIHWKKVVLPQPEVRDPRQRLRWRLDNLFVLGAVAATGAGAVALARAAGVDAPAPWLLLWALVVPYAVTAWLLGFLTYLHHTHPRIPWFRDEAEWSFHRGQVLGTAHVRFGGPIDGAIHNIMEHTAHHVDPRIPLYRLARAQDDLEVRFSDDVVGHRFTFRSFAYLQRVCRLYDFEGHRWLDWSGEPTSRRTFEPA